MTRREPVALPVLTSALAAAGFALLFFVGLAAGTLVLLAAATVSTLWLAVSENASLLYRARMIFGASMFVVAAVLILIYGL